MAKVTKDTKAKLKAPAPADSAAQTGPADAQTHPADGELSFQHVIRNMVVAREEARRQRVDAPRRRPIS